MRVNGSKRISENIIGKSLKFTHSSPQQILNRINFKEITLRHIIIKLSEGEDKERILKARRNNSSYTWDPK